MPAESIPPVIPSTTQLHAAAIAGSQQAWAALVDRYSRLVWRVVRSFRLGDAASEDVVQVTWFRLVEHIDRICDPERIGGWLATTARNESLAALRRRDREAPVASYDHLDAMVASLDADEIVADAERSIVAEAFATLSDGDQQLLLQAEEGQRRCDEAEKEDGETQQGAGLLDHQPAIGETLADTLGATLEEAGGDRRDDHDHRRVGNAARFEELKPAERLLVHGETSGDQHVAPA